MNKVIASSGKLKLVVDDAENYCITTATSEQIPVQILINDDQFDKDGLEWFISKEEDLYIKYRSNLWNGITFLETSGYTLKKELRNVYDLKASKWVKADTALIISSDPVRMEVVLS